MNDRIEKCTRDLLEALRECEEYKTFEENKERMKEHPELRSKMDAFRKKVYLIQNSNTPMDRLDEMSKLFKERQEIYGEPLVAEYMEAELHMCRILQKISMEIMGVTKVELDAFDDVIDF